MPGVESMGQHRYSREPRREAWWRDGVVYQVYPRSFRDASGDGLGDLTGIPEKLGYPSWLGVDALCINPIYPSPVNDVGYDITDHEGVDPLFGTLEDFDLLVDEAHRHGLKVVFDFVSDHASSRHPWFVESRSSRHNPKRDGYLWRDLKPDGSPPNNWVSPFGGSHRAFDERTGHEGLVVHWV